MFLFWGNINCNCQKYFKQYLDPETHHYFLSCWNTLMRSHVINYHHRRCHLISQFYHHRHKQIVISTWIIQSYNILSSILLYFLLLEIDSLLIQHSDYSFPSLFSFQFLPISPAIHSHSLSRSLESKRHLRGDNKIYKMKYNKIKKNYYSGIGQDKWTKGIKIKRRHRNQKPIHLHPGIVLKILN